MGGRIGPGGVALLLAAGPGLLAQGAKGDPTWAELADLLETPVVAASKREQRAAESPQAVEVLSGDFLASAGIFRFADALRLATGVDVFEMGTRGARISMRGVAPGGAYKSVQVLVDGAPLFNSEILAIDPETIPIPLAAVERIEVVRGPASSLYGANAQTGVVAISSLRARPGLSGSLRMAAGPGGASRQQAALMFGRGGFSLLASAGGFSRPDSKATATRVVGLAGEVPQEDQVRGAQVHLRPRFETRHGTFWAAFGEAYLDGNPETTERPSDGLKLVRIPRQRPATQVAQTGWSRTWASDLRSEVRLHHLSQTFSFGPFSAGTPGHPVSEAVLASQLSVDPALAGNYTWLDFRSLEGAFQVNWDPTAAVHLVAGADARAMTGRRSPLMGFRGDQKATGSGVFASADWERGDWLFSGGLRAENETLGGSRLSPRLSAVWRAKPNLVLRGAYLTSTRSPQMGEAFLDVRTSSFTIAENRGLQPERVRAFEVGARFSAGPLSADLTAYRMDLDRTITLMLTGRTVQVGGNPVPERQFRNQGSSRPAGFEMALAWDGGDHWSLGLQAAYSRHQDPALGSQTDYAPAHRCTLWGRARRGSLQAFAALRRVGAYTVFGAVAGATRRHSVPAAWNAMAHLAWEPRPGFTLSAYGQHLLREATPTVNNWIQDSHQLLYTRREWGVQLGWRF